MNRFARAFKEILAVCAVSVAVLAAPPVAASQSGVPVAEDSPLYKAFNQLKDQPNYRVTINMEMKDTRMAKMAAAGMGMGAMEKVVQGNTTQVTMHMKMPATDQPGTIDDWEIRAVVKDGRAARLITSPAVPRLLKKSDQMLDMQMAMMEKQAAMSLAQALAKGPLGPIEAAMQGATAAANLAAGMAVKRNSHEFFSWQCIDRPQQQNERTAPALTGMHTMADQKIGAVDAAAYEFFVNENGKSQGPVRLLIAKDSGLPLRIDMNDPEGRGSVHMDYVDFGKTAHIEIPECLGK